MTTRGLPQIVVFFVIILLRGSVINRILREARNVDVHVVANRAPERDA